MVYTEKQKMLVLQKVLPPSSKPVREVSEECGVPSQTIYRWMANLRKENQPFNILEPTIPIRKSNLEKFSLLLESKTISDKGAITFLVKNLPLGEILDLTVKAFDEEILLGETNTKIGPIGINPSITIGVVPAGDSVIELEWGEEGDSWNTPEEFYQSDIYIFKFPMPEKGVYSIYDYYEEGSNLNQFTTSIINSEGFKRSDLLKIEELQENNGEPPYHFFANNKKEDLYLILESKTLEKTDEPNFFIEKHNGSVIVLKENGYNEYELLYDNDYWVDFGQLGPENTTTLSFILYNPYSFPITIKDFTYKYTTDEGYVGSGFSLPELPNDPIAPWEKFEFNVVYDRKNGGGDRKAKFAINFDNLDTFNLFFEGSTCG